MPDNLELPPQPTPRPNPEHFDRSREQSTFGSYLDIVSNAAEPLGRSIVAAGTAAGRALADTASELVVPAFSSVAQLGRDVLHAAQSQANGFRVGQDGTLQLLPPENLRNTAPQVETRDGVTTRRWTDGTNVTCEQRTLANGAEVMSQRLQDGQMHVTAMLEAPRPAGAGGSRDKITFEYGRNAESGNLECTSIGITDTATNETHTERLGRIGTSVGRVTRIEAVNDEQRGPGYRIESDARSFVAGYVNQQTVRHCVEHTYQDGKLKVYPNRNWDETHEAVLARGRTNPDGHGELPVGAVVSTYTRNHSGMFDRYSANYSEHTSVRMPDGVGSVEARYYASVQAGETPQTLLIGESYRQPRALTSQQLAQQLGYQVAGDARNLSINNVTGWYRDRDNGSIILLTGTSNTSDGQTSIDENRTHVWNVRDGRTIAGQSEYREPRPTIGR
jgi:hypothetical protein